MRERGATESEVTIAVLQGERFAAKHGRSGFRKNFPFEGEWQGRSYQNKQIEAYAVKEQDGQWLVITVIVKYF